MKKVLITGIFVFSLALNAATLGTLGWHFWTEKKAEATGSAVNAELPRQDVKDIFRLWPPSARTKLRELRGQIRAKRAEIIDILAANPGNPQAAEETVRELTALREQMEKQALAAISEVMAKLPPEKRDAFVHFLKTRSRMGPGMGGMGHGRHFRRRHLGDMPPCQAPQDSDASTAPAGKP